MVKKGWLIAMDANAVTKLGRDTRRIHEAGEKNRGQMSAEGP